MEYKPLLLLSAFLTLDESYTGPWRRCASQAVEPWQWGSISLAARLFAADQHASAQHRLAVAFYHHQADGRQLCAALCRVLEELHVCKQLCHAIQGILRAHATDPLFVQTGLVLANERVSLLLEMQRQRIQYDIGAIAAHYVVPLRMEVQVCEGE